MGYGPAFNVEVSGLSEEGIRPIISDVIEEFIETNSGFEWEGDLPLSSGDEVSGTLRVPESMNTDDTSYRDYLEVVYLEEQNEYLGNRGEGLTVGYQCYYAEDMDTLWQKLEVLDEFEALLSRELSDERGVEIESYASVATI